MSTAQLSVIDLWVQDNFHINYKLDRLQMFKTESKRLHLYFITASFWQIRAWSLQTDWSSCVTAKHRSNYFISQVNCTALWQMLVEMSHGPWWDKSTLKHNLHIEQKLCLSKNCHYAFFPSMRTLCVRRLNKRSWILILTWAFASSMEPHQTPSLHGQFFTHHTGESLLFPHWQAAQVEGPVVLPNKACTCLSYLQCK